MEDALQKQAAVETHSIQAKQFQSRYDSEMVDPYSTCFAYSRMRLNEWLAKFLPPASGLSLLDVGCGTGHHMKALRERGYAVSGVDGSDKMLDVARELNPAADVRQCDVDKLPHADGTFDRVLSIEVLRYLPNVAPAAMEMARVLKPGGVAVITAAPRFNVNGYALVNRFATAFPSSKFTALRQFFTTAGEIKSTLKAAGFREVEVHGVYTGPINWVERLARPLLKPVLKMWGPLDVMVCDLGPLRELANMFVVRAVK